MEELSQLHNQLERIAIALERLAGGGKPIAPNLVRPMEEYAGFDWAAIGAEIVKDDADGPTHVQHNGILYTRRSPTNKYEPAIWYSAPAGKDGEGNTEYVRLITFRNFGEADPLPGKVNGELRKPAPAPAAPQAPAKPVPSPAPARPTQPPKQQTLTRPYSPDLLKVKLVEWAEQRLNQPCTASHRTLLAGMLEKAAGGKLPRHEMSEWLFGAASTADIPCELVLAALKDWLEIKDWNSQPSQTAIQEARAAHQAALAFIKKTQKA